LRLGTVVVVVTVGELALFRGSDYIVPAEELLFVLARAVFQAGVYGVGIPVIAVII